MKTVNKKIVITGGGSGGHISVATAFLDALESNVQIPKENILYIGTDLGMVGEKVGTSLEQKIMQDREVNFTTIRAGKLQRRFEFATIKLLFRAILGVIDSYRIIKSFKPDIIFCTGGYLAVPVAIAGWANKIPIYLHEQTAAVGLANGFVAKVAKRVYISFKSSQKYFPKDKTLLTGNIVRKDIFKTDGKTELCKQIKVMKQINSPIIYISGGGQGSHILNLLVRDMMKYALLDYQIILQTGDNKVLRDYDVIKNDWNKLPERLKQRIYITKFVNNDEIGCVLNNVDLYVGRAGANIVYEVGVLRIPSIFIPIPWVTHNEQELNARILESYGLAKIILEGEVTSGKLHSEIKKSLASISNMQIDNEGLKNQFPLNAQEVIIKDMFN